MMTVIMLLLSAIVCHAAPTAEQVMRKAAATINGTVTVSYRISGSHSAAGQITASGNKFFIDAGKSKVWYDGKVMTTLNLNSNEATLTHPTSAEVNETFPLSYVATWKKDYRVEFAKQQPKNGYCVILTSKNQSAAARKAVLTVNSSNFQPQKLVISLKNGGKATVTVTSIRRGMVPSLTNSFRYPKQRFPEVKIVDLSY